MLVSNQHHREKKATALHHLTFISHSNNLFLRSSCESSTACTLTTIHFAPSIQAANQPANVLITPKTFPKIALCGKTSTKQFSPTHWKGKKIQTHKVQCGKSSIKNHKWHKHFLLCDPREACEMELCSTPAWQVTRDNAGCMRTQFLGPVSRSVSRFFRDYLFFSIYLQSLKIKWQFQDCELLL